MNKYIFRKIMRILKLHKRNRYITEEFEGNKITFDVKSDIGSQLYYNGAFEEKEIELCKKYLKADSVVLDIGANIGIHSIYFSRMAKDGLIFSFEPSPETFSVLLKNVSQIQNIIPINIGISDAKKIADFYMATDNAYSGLKDTRRKEIKKLVKVVCFTIDNFFKEMNLKNIDFIKIDVEGNEHSVLVGMSWVIEKYRPVIFCEIYKGTNSNENPERTVHYLINKGYEAFVFDGAGFVKFQQHRDEFYNYLFLPRDCK